VAGDDHICSPSWKEVVDLGKGAVLALNEDIVKNKKGGEKEEGKNKRERHSYTSHRPLGFRPKTSCQKKKK